MSGLSVIVGLTLAAKTAEERDTLNLQILLEPEKRSVKSCKLARTLTALPEPYKTALQNLLASDLPDEPLTKKIQLAGLELSYSSVYRHRRALCKCESMVNV